MLFDNKNGDDAFLFDVGANGNADDNPWDNDSNASVFSTHAKAVQKKKADDEDKEGPTLPGSRINQPSQPSEPDGRLLAPRSNAHTIPKAHSQGILSSLPTTPSPSDDQKAEKDTLDHDAEPDELILDDIKPEPVDVENIPERIAGKKDDDKAFPLFYSFKANDPIENVSDGVKQKYGMDAPKMPPKMPVSNIPPAPMPKPTDDIDVMSAYDHSLLPDDDFDIDFPELDKPIFKPLATNDVSDKKDTASNIDKDDHPEDVTKKAPEPTNAAKVTASLLPQKKAEDLSAPASVVKPDITNVADTSEKKPVDTAATPHKEPDKTSPLSTDTAAAKIDAAKEPPKPSFAFSSFARPDEKKPEPADKPASVEKPDIAKTEPSTVDKTAPVQDKDAAKEPPKPSFAFSSFTRPDEKKPEPADKPASVEKPDIAKTEPSTVDKTSPVQDKDAAKGPPKPSFAFSSFTRPDENKPEPADKPASAEKPDVAKTVDKEPTKDTPKPSFAFSATSLAATQKTDEADKPASVERPDVTKAADKKPTKDTSKPSFAFSATSLAATDKPATPSRSVSTDDLPYSPPPTFKPLPPEQKDAAPFVGSTSKSTSSSSSRSSSGDPNMSTRPGTRTTSQDSFGQTQRPTLHVKPKRRRSKKPVIIIFILLFVLVGGFFVLNATGMLSDLLLMLENRINDRSVTVTAQTSLVETEPTETEPEPTETEPEPTETEPEPTETEPEPTEPEPTEPIPAGIPASFSTRLHSATASGTRAEFTISFTNTSGYDVSLFDGMAWLEITYDTQSAATVLEVFSDHFVFEPDPDRVDVFIGTPTSTEQIPDGGTLDVVFVANSDLNYGRYRVQYIYESYNEEE